MFAGLQNLIYAHYFIGITTFFKYKNYVLILRENYVLLLKKSQGMYLKTQSKPTKQSKHEQPQSSYKFNYVLMLNKKIEICTYV